VLAAGVTASSVHNCAGPHPVVAQAKDWSPTLAIVVVDSGFAEQCVQTISQVHGVLVQIVCHPATENVCRCTHPAQGDLFAIPSKINDFKIPPNRWKVQHSRAWNECTRHL
jgi:hypothetical protein